jgi:hypothetical protein
MRPDALGTSRNLNTRHTFLSRPAWRRSYGQHLTDEELEEIEGKCEGRAKAVLALRTASKQAERQAEGD